MTFNILGTSKTLISNSRKESGNNAEYSVFLCVLCGAVVKENAHESMNHKKQILFAWLLLAFCLFPSFSFAQKSIFGTIYDEETGTPLPSATIQVEGMNIGTITNAEGKYRLFIPKLPAMMEVRYLGYESKRIALNIRSAQQQDVRLKLGNIQSSVVEITGEDPAVKIMRKVLEEKQTWFSELETYSYEVYSRFNLIKKSTEFASKEPEIIQIIESSADAYWHKPRGSREWIRAKRYVPSRVEDFPYAGLEPVQNFYDNTVWLQGRIFHTPLHPQALDEYAFRLGDQRPSSRGETIYDIYVTPKREYDRTLRGRITVRTNDFVVLEAELQPNKFPTNLGDVRDRDAIYTQQFMDYGGRAMLPADFKVEGRVAFGLKSAMRPPALYRQVSKMSKYRLNEPVLDELFLSLQRLQTEQGAETRAELLKNGSDLIPYTEAELKAMSTLTGRFSLMSEFPPQGFTFVFGAGGGGLTMDRESAAMNVKMAVDGAMANYMKRLQDIAQNRYKPDWGRYADNYYERLLGKDKIIIEARVIQYVKMLDVGIRFMVLH